MLVIFLHCGLIGSQTGVGQRHKVQRLQPSHSIPSTITLSTTDCKQSSGIAVQLDAGGQTFLSLQIGQSEQVKLLTTMVLFSTLMQSLPRSGQFCGVGHSLSRQTGQPSQTRPNEVVKVETPLLTHSAGSGVQPVGGGQS